EESEYLTPKATTSVLPKATKKDETDDSLDSLVGGTTLGDTSDSSGGIHERVENKSVQTPAKLTISDGIPTKPEQSKGSGAGGSVPSTSCSGGEGDLYYFYTSSGLCYLDDYRNVFFEDGALVHDGSSDSESNASFYIDGVLYWFVPGGLLYQDAGGAFYRVATYAVGTEQNPNQLDPSQAPDGLQGPQDDTDALQPSLDNKLDCDSHSAPPTTSNSSLGGDIVDHLADLFSGKCSANDSINVNGGINHDPARDELPSLKQDLNLKSVSKYKLMDDEPVQPPPSKPNVDKKYYFHASSRFYYFDDHRR
ncbi:hypothetical protein RSAG8_05973, partial [Rhizoctonia solani AG-8 WAC10335]